MDIWVLSITYQCLANLYLLKMQILARPLHICVYRMLQKITTTHTYDAPDAIDNLDRLPYRTNNDASALRK